MTVRLAIGDSASIRGPLLYDRPGHWLDGAPWEAIAKIGTYGAWNIYANDFLGWDGPAVEMAATDASAGWIITVVDGGTDSAETVAIRDSVENGVLRITTNNADNDNTVLQRIGEPWRYNSGKKAFFAVRFASGDANDGEIFVGLCTADTNPFSTAPTDGLWFEKAETATTMTFVAAKNSVQATASSIDTTAMVDGTFHEYGFRVNSSGSIDVFYDGTDVGTIAAGNASLPDDEDLKLTFAIQTGDLDVIQLDIDYVICAFER